MTIGEAVPPGITPMRLTVPFPSTGIDESSPNRTLPVWDCLFRSVSGVFVMCELAAVSKIHFVDLSGVAEVCRLTASESVLSDVTFACSSLSESLVLDSLSLLSLLHSFHACPVYRPWG